MATNSKTGVGAASGDIPVTETLGAFGKTMLAAVGVDPSVIASQITTGQVVSAALNA